jgi:PAS domain S-box-containing protein
MVMVSERGQLDKSVQESQNLLVSIIGSAMDAIIAIDDAQRIVMFNAAAEKMFGCPADEAMGNSIERFIPQCFRAERSAPIRRFGERGITDRAMGTLGTLWGLRATGEQFPIEASISEVESGDKKFFTAVIRDITERHDAEEAVRESEERFRLAAQAGKMYAYTWDAATDVIVRSPDNTSVLGFSTGKVSLTRQQLLTRVHPDDRALFNASLSVPTPECPDVQISYRLLRPDGSVIWVEKTAHAFFDEGGRIMRMIGMVADITDRKRAEDAIRESEMQYRRIVETTNEGVWVLDSNLHNSYVNLQMAEMLGYEPGEMVGRSVFDFYFPEDVERKKQVLTRRQQGLREQVEERLRRRDGSELWVRIAGTPVLKDNGEFDGALAMVSDITERKLAEQALRENEERLRLAAQAGKMYAFEWDVTTDLLVRSSEYVNVLGASEPKTLTHQQAMEKIHPDDRPKLIAAVAEHSLENPTVHVTYRVLRPGKSPLWLKSSGRAFFDTAGRILRVIGMVADVTDHKLAEQALSDMSARLIAAQEQERARIARELHDDINQRIALLAIELEQLQYNPSEVSSRLQELRKRTTDISNNVQALSHDLHSSQLEYLGVIAAMKSWCKEFAERQKMEIAFRHDVQSTLPPEIGLCLFRVVQEALHNAAKHSGVKRVEVQLEENSGEMQLIIEDLGKGFDIEAAREARGLGITSMRERVRLVNGTIVIQSKPMAGTTIHVHIPFAPEHGSQRAAG